MRKMKAAVFVAPRRIDLDDRPIPNVGSLDALVRITTTTICGTDVHIVKGEYRVKQGLTVGVIEQLGAEYVLVPDAMANLSPVPNDLTDEQVLMCRDIMSTVGAKLTGANHDHCGRIGGCTREDSASDSTLIKLYIYLFLNNKTGSPGRTRKIAPNPRGS